MPHRILKLLRERPDPVSGERISTKLGLTRAAVWKKIGTLRDKGFVIDGVPSRGYRLLSSPDLSADEVLSLLSGDFWKRILFQKSVGSTNEVASALSSHDDNGGAGSVLIADAQERGRGRLGRRWISPAALNIYMSIVLRPDILPRDVTLLTLLAAVASARGIRRSTGADVSIKWPNDLVASEKKVGGILTEARSDLDRITQAVVGIGINVNMACRNLPDGIDMVATSLMDETGKRHSRSEIIAAILEEFEYWYKLLVRSGRGALLTEWRKLSSTLGRRVSAVTAQETLEGRAEDIDDEGMLILELPSGEKRRIAVGDLTMLR
jgi:BirA family biotin operon repressor/biotin-[acetyl-CoA-carboxylase] ligase